MRGPTRQHKKRKLMSDAQEEETLFPIELNETITTLPSKSFAWQTNVHAKKQKMMTSRTDWTVWRKPDDVEQYSRRPNLRFHSFPEADTPENTDQLIINMVNSKLKEHRPIIARFRSEILRDVVYKCPPLCRSNKDLVRSALVHTWQCAQATRQITERKYYYRWTAHDVTYHRSLLENLIQEVNDLGNKEKMKAGLKAAVGDNSHVHKLVQPVRECGASFKPFVELMRI